MRLEIITSDFESEEYLALTEFLDNEGLEYNVVDDRLLGDDIDTIGKCANCGVEFHIHKIGSEDKIFTEQDIITAFDSGAYAGASETNISGHAYLLNKYGIK